MRSPLDIQAHLKSTLDKMGTFPTCALLNYPNYINLGDHLIWLGNLFYLVGQRGVKVAYTASSSEFSPEDLDKATDQLTTPILLSGGGNFGDIWHDHQRFREKIIQKYRDRPIVILPQTFYFQDPEKLAQAARIFNDHPALTIFVRDTVSYDKARAAFHHCQVELAPDTAFMLTDIAKFPRPSPSRGILYHCRTDAELLTQVNFNHLPLPVEMQDWLAYEDRWLMGPDAVPWKQTVATGIRAGWQRGLKHPRQWWSRLAWDREFYPSSCLENVYNPLRQHQSWSFIYSAIYQFQQYQLIITNRLHGHILATLLGIPHIFLPNSYHKNSAFYHTWTQNIPYCCFVENPQEISGAVKELLTG